MFLNFTKPFLKDFSEHIQKDDMVKGASFPSVYKYLHKEILDICIPSLVYELNIYRKNNKLIGKTSRERYIYFENLTYTKLFRTKFFLKYPVLKQLITRRLDDTLFFLDEIIMRFRKDYEILNKNFNVSSQKIVDIKLGSGDIHNHGRSVAFVYTDTEKIIYKPHSLKTDLLMHELINIINQNISLKLKHIPSIDCKKYGWQQIIIPNLPISKNIVKQVYTRLGEMQALFYSLMSSDMHYENIVISNKYPYVIDTETLINCSRQPLCRKDLNTLEDSVIYNSLLPVKQSNTVVDIDFSGIFGGKVKSKLIKTMVLKDKELDTMHMKEELVQGEEKHYNKISGDVSKYLPQFITGFKIGIKTIIDNKNKIIEMLSDFQRISTRTLTRHTLVYAKFLQAGENPQYLTSTEKRNELLKILYENGKNIDQNQLKNEIEVLNYGEIPIYYCRFDSKGLFSSEKQISKDYFKMSPKESLIRHLKDIDQEQIEHQLYLIRMCYSLSYRKFFRNKKIVPRISHRNSELEIKKIYNRITNGIFYDHINKVYQLLYTHLRPDGQVIGGVSTSLYENLGMIIYVYYYEKYYNPNNPVLEKLLIRWTDRFNLKSHQIGNSAFEGLGAVLYTTYLLRNCAFLKNSDDFIISILKALKERLTNKSLINLDYLNGDFSTIHLIFNIWNNTSDKKIKSECYTVLGKYGKILTEIKTNNFPFYHTIGIAHGLSGAALAYGILGHVLKEYTFTNLSHIYLNKEDIRFNEFKKNASWCRGTTGVLLTRMILKSFDDTIRINTVTEYFNATLKTKSFKGVGLCHGIYGVVDILSIYQKYHYPILNKKQVKITNKLKKSPPLFQKKGKFQLETYHDFQLQSFMLGTSGIAYSILKNYVSLPSILALEV